MSKLQYLKKYKEVKKKSKDSYKKKRIELVNGVDTELFHAQELDELPVIENIHLLKEEIQQGNKSECRNNVAKGDVSPPRKRKQRMGACTIDGDLSPPRKRKQRMGACTIDGDLSPPRRNASAKTNADGDLSPPRRNASNSSGLRSKDNLEREGSRQERKMDGLNSNRTSRCGDSLNDRRNDASSRREDRRERDGAMKQEGSGKKSRWEGEERRKQDMASGHQAGLQSGRDFGKKEAELRKEKMDFSVLNAKDTGKQVETVYRDRKGRKLDMLNEMQRQEDIRQGKARRQAAEEYEWGTGAVQKEQLKDRVEELKEMKTAPFARYKNDAKLEQVQKSKQHLLDPINSKVFEMDPTTQRGSKTSTKSKSKHVYEAVKKKYKGPPAPPNRFNILPGYRWDGVIRGNNWEEAIMLKQNAKMAAKDDAYKYAVADM